MPGVGDTAAIHSAVSVDHNAVIGASGAGGSVAITVSGNGALTIGSGAALTVRGDIVLDNAPLRLTAGSRLLFDASGAASPPATHYALRIGAAPNQPNAVLRLEGTPGARCRIESSAANGAAPAYITNSNFAQGGLVSGSYVDFVRIGDPARPSIAFSLVGNGIFTLENATFDTCGTLTAASPIADGTILSLKNIAWKNTQGADSLDLDAQNPLTSGLREVTGCVFDQEVKFYPPTGISITNNLFSRGFGVLDGAWAEFRGNLIVLEGAERRIAASVKDDYWLVDAPSMINPHFLQALSFGRDMVVDGEIFEFTGNNSDGDCVLVGLAQQPALLTIRNCIVLPNAAGENSGTLFSALGDGNASIIAEHNTYFVGSQGAAVGETYAGHSGMLRSFRSNLAWDSTPRGYKLFDSGADERVTDLVSSASADYNGGHNLLTGSSGTGYAGLEFSAGLPGVHDVGGDPNFVDPTRNIGQWDRSLGGPGTAAHALGELRKKNDPAGYDARYSIAALFAYVRAGFLPRNPAYRGSAHDGGDIGAVSRSTIPPTPTVPPAVLPTGGSGGGGAVDGTGSSGAGVTSARRPHRISEARRRALARARARARRRARAKARATATARAVATATARAEVRATVRAEARTIARAEGRPA